MIIPNRKLSMLLTIGTTDGLIKAILRNFWRLQVMLQVSWSLIVFYADLIWMVMLK